MAAKREVDASQHFDELIRYFGQEDYDKALKVVNALLKDAPDDQQALQSKVACLVHLSKFAEAMEVAENVGEESSVLLPVTYSLYRLNRYAEIMLKLKAISNADLSLELKELKAQTLYKLEKYDECLELYKELLKKQRDDLDSERQCNFLAVLTQLQQQQSNRNNNKVPAFTPSAFETYELAFNSAAFLLAKGNLVEAEKKLHKAEKLFREFAQEEQLDAEKIRHELTTLKTQLVRLQLESAKKQPVDKPAGFSVESVESNFLNQFAKLKKKPKKDQQSSGGDATLNSPKATSKDKPQLQPGIKKKRKRKPRLPKNYDPNVKPDPERWLPKVERSTYKKKKDKRSNVGKGTQGSTLPEQQQSAAAPSTPKPGYSAAAQANQPTGPRQQKPQAATKKQGKKNKRK